MKEQLKLVKGMKFDVEICRKTYHVEITSEETSNPNAVRVTWDKNISINPGPAFYHLNFAQYAIEDENWKVVENTIQYTEPQKKLVVSVVGQSNWRVIQPNPALQYFDTKHLEEELAYRKQKLDKAAANILPLRNGMFFECKIDTTKYKAVVESNTVYLHWQDGKIKGFGIHTLEGATMNIKSGYWNIIEGKVRKAPKVKTLRQQLQSRIAKKTATINEITENLHVVTDTRVYKDIKELLRTLAEEQRLDKRILGKMKE